MRKLLPAALLAGAVARAACGDGDGSSEGAKRPNGTDRAFVAAMVPHHESAVEMAEIAQERGRSPFVKKLAEDIIRTQNAEILVMRREDEALETAGVKRGELGVPEHMTGMDGEPADLRAAQDFDKEFLTMMIPHHEGAIEMARAELGEGGDRELREIAGAIIEAQDREITEMRRQLGDDAPADAHESGH